MMCMSRKICKLLVFLLLAISLADANTITYILNGGVNDPDNPTAYGNDASKKIELKPATRDGYVFLGWYVEPNKESVSPNTNFESHYKGYSESSIARSLGNFTVYARWGLVPKTPSKDDRGCYLVHDAEELYGFREAYDAEKRATYTENIFACVSLQNDIVVNKNLLDGDGNLATDDYVWWQPLYFLGTFEGNGFTISGLRGEGGLFEELREKSIVRNLGIKDSYFSANTAGGLVGTIEEGAWIYNVYSEASVHGVEYAGGLVGAEPVNVNCLLCARGLSTSRVRALDVDYSKVSAIENAYSLGVVEGKTVGGIVANMNTAVLRNVFFAGKLQGTKSDCIVAVKDYVCSPRDSIFVIENALCMDSKKTSVSKATSLSKEQFADGTALEILSKGDGLRWTQKIGTDSHPVFNGVKAEIRYVLNGGENDEKNPSYFALGDKTFALNEPHKANDVFEGWFSDSAFKNKIDSIDTRNLDERVLFAKWKSRYIITLKTGKYRSIYGNRYCDGSCEIEWSADSSAFVLKEAKVDGYSFEAWYADSLLTQKITEISKENTENITVYANWTPIVYTITYHLVGGVNHPDNPTTYTVVSGVLKLKDPTREGAVFSHWRIENSVYWGNPLSAPPTDKDYYAQWTPIPQEPIKNSNGCYLIYTKEELYWLAKSADKKSCASLQKDIVVNENLLKDSTLNLDTNSYFAWNPITSFEGSFVGNGHSISGLYLNSNDTYDEYKYGYLFRNAQRDAKIDNFEIKDSYCNGIVKSRVIGQAPINNWGALPKMELKSAWSLVVNGKSVAMSGLVPGKTLLVMDIQGRVLRKQVTESSVTLDFPHSGRYLIRYGIDTRPVIIH